MKWNIYLILYFLRSSVEAKRVLSFTTQNAMTTLQNSAENGEQSVLTLSCQPTLLFRVCGIQREAILSTFYIPFLNSPILQAMYNNLRYK